MQRAPALCGVWEGCQWQALPSPVQCEETVTRTQDLPVTGGKTLPLAPGPPFFEKKLILLINKLRLPNLLYICILRVKANGYMHTEALKYMIVQLNK